MTRALRALAAATAALSILAGASEAQGGPPAASTGPARPPAQARPAGADSGQARPARQGRRAIDIRATAPAPEVVTIRPREIPEFPRTLALPDNLPAIRVPGDREPATVVIFPGGPIPVPPPPAARPEPTRPPHE